MSPRFWTRAAAELAERDPVLAGLIARYPGERLKSRSDLFTTLARAIVGQQISVKAADALWRRLDTAVGGVAPATLAAAEAEALLGAGMSRAKTAYLGDLGRRFHEEAIDPKAWRRMDDDAVIADLTRIRGIGRWTAEMVLIFTLMRPDVLPLDDLGLQRAICLHYFKGRPRARETMRRLARAWQPWRSVATWYLWRSLDPVPVEY